MNDKIMEIFCEIPCLTERSKSYKGLDLQKKWFKNADKRKLGDYLLKFAYYNKDVFNFLGVTPIIQGSEISSTILFKTTNYVGTIPLRSPDTGKQIGDFVVSPRFTGSDRYAEYISILNLLNHDITHEVMESLTLTSGRLYQPPLYLEASKFIYLVVELINSKWIKFNREEKNLHEPIGQVNWQKYVNNEYKVENRLIFPVGRNILNEFHSEYSQIKYVFEICEKEIFSINTPLRIKIALREKIQFIEEKLHYHRSEAVTEMRVNVSDPVTVRRCKVQANRILSRQFTEGNAWRVDFSDVFEKFIQFIFKLIAKENGGRLLSNFQFHGHSSKPFTWALNHLEPDAIYQKDSFEIMIDAKYKSHLFNIQSTSSDLKEEYRHDLHQVLCYSSFSHAIPKLCFLCYPAPTQELNFIRYLNSSNGVENHLGILGVPFSTQAINDAKSLLLKVISGFENAESSKDAFDKERFYIFT